jgi:iron complex transport system ATP-binding protein
VIEIKGLSKAYDGTPVVDDVTLTLPRGGVTGIIGPNGAGKSTLLGLISRLLAADTGTVRVGGLDVARTPGEELSRHMSVLKQDNHVATRLTVRDLVGFGRFPHSRGRLGPDDHVHIESALAHLELGALAERHLDELSGGQRQRAFVAMALCQDTDYMLFDEPLASLDIRHAVSMMHLLRKAARENGKTVVIVLHDINLAANFSDTIIAMKDARVACHGAPEAVITGERLSAIYGLPIEVHRVSGQLVTTYSMAQDSDTLRA